VGGHGDDPLQPADVDLYMGTSGPGGPFPLYNHAPPGFPEFVVRTNWDDPFAPTVKVDERLGFQTDFRFFFAGYVL
jgi:hypothetical protein